MVPIPFFSPLAVPHHTTGAGAGLDVSNVDDMTVAVSTATSLGSGDWDLEGSNDGGTTWVTLIDGLALGVQAVPYKMQQIRVNAISYSSGDEPIVNVGGTKYRVQ